nr:hypothetical protein CFP56_69334 [Quercus suber]
MNLADMVKTHNPPLQTFTVSLACLSTGMSEMSDFKSFGACGVPLVQPVAHREDREQRSHRVAQRRFWLPTATDRMVCLSGGQGTLTLGRYGTKPGKLHDCPDIMGTKARLLR